MIILCALMLVVPRIGCAQGCKINTVPDSSTLSHANPQLPAYELVY